MTPQAAQAYQALNVYIESHYPGMDVQTEGKTRYGLRTLRYRKSGKWIRFPAANSANLENSKKLLAIKRRPK